MKLVDAVVPPADLIKTAKDWIKAGGKAPAPWDVEGFRLPGGPVYSKAGMMTFPPANAIYRRETYDNYPGARAILQVVYEGLQLPMDLALRVESRWFAKILRTPEAAAMIRSLFVSMQELNKGARRPADVPPTTLKKVGVIGAGFMGAGIAYVTRARRHRGGADRPRPGIRRQGQGAFPQADDRADQQGPRQARPSATRCSRASRRPPTMRALEDCDLVIEAVFEDRKVKAEAIAKAQAVMRRQGDLRLQHLDAADHLAGGGVQGPGALHRHAFLLAGRADDAGRGHPRQEDRRRRARRRARLCARHPQDADRGQRLARLLRQPLRAQLYSRRPPDADRGRAGGDDRECRRAWPACRSGRCRSTTRSRSISAGRSSRPPKPISGRRRSIRSRRRCCRSWSRSAAGSAARTARASTTIRRAGRSGCGRALPICRRRSSIPTGSTSSELKHRFLAVQALEAARCVEEGVITDVREADVGSILGCGFAPFSGGTLSYIDMMGTKRFVDLCKRLEKKYGPRFKAPSFWSTWRRRTIRSTAASRPAARRRRDASHASTALA